MPKKYPKRECDAVSLAKRAATKAKTKRKNILRYNAARRRDSLLKTIAAEGVSEELIDVLFLDKIKVGVEAALHGVEAAADLGFSDQFLNALINWYKGKKQFAENASPLDLSAEAILEFEARYGSD